MKNFAFFQIKCNSNKPMMGIELALRGFWVADYDLEVGFLKFKMADPIW